jgi:hypothetical protein
MINQLIKLLIAYFLQTDCNLLVFLREIIQIIFRHMHVSINVLMTMYTNISIVLIIEMSQVSDGKYKYILSKIM